MGVAGFQENYLQKKNWQDHNLLTTCINESNHEVFNRNNYKQLSL